MNFAQLAVAQHIQNKYPTLFTGDISGLVKDIPSHIDPAFTSLDDYIAAKEALVQQAQESRLSRLESEMEEIQDRIFELEERADEKRTEIDLVKSALGMNDD